MSLYHSIWPPHTHIYTYTHTITEMRLFKVQMQMKSLCVWLFPHHHSFLWQSFFVAPLGKTHEVLHHPCSPPQYPYHHLHSHFMCLYFNSSPGTTSLLNTFSDIFPDHFYNLGTPAIKIATWETRKKKRHRKSLHHLIEYFSSESECLKSLGKSTE